MARNTWKKHEDLKETIMSLLKTNVISTVHDLHKQISKDSSVSYGTIKRCLNSLKNDNLAVLVMLPNQKMEFWTTTILLNSKSIDFLCPQG